MNPLFQIIIFLIKYINYFDILIAFQTVITTFRNRIKILNHNTD